MRRGTDALETINAAANVIASAENRVPQPMKRRWGSCWRIYWCFGTQKTKRIGHAVLVPEPTTTEAHVPEAERPLQPPSLVIPFAAPPSSPASFIPSGPPSATQSPTGGILSLSVSANMYSPSGPASIFAIGPYAHEQQLVSPPVFSTFTTEPSTAPYTPPPESVHMTTTPSSPEVPFARLLEPNLRNDESGSRYPSSPYEFQSYQLQPGSPVSHLISPSSGISNSGTSSPFLDRDFTAVHPFFLEFKTGNPPTLLDLEMIVRREFGISCQESGAVTPDAVASTEEGRSLNRQNSDVGPLPNTGNAALYNKETVADHRVSFEINNEEVITGVDQKSLALSKRILESVENVKRLTQEKTLEMGDGVKYTNGETSDEISKNTHCGGEIEKQYEKTRTFTLGSAKEFNFDSIDGVISDEPRIDSSDWWKNESTVSVEEEGKGNNWSFFPVMQTGVS